jgi:hypothetical protein
MKEVRVRGSGHLAQHFCGLVTSEDAVAFSIVVGSKVVGVESLASGDEENIYGPAIVVKAH